MRGIVEDGEVRARDISQGREDGGRMSVGEYLYFGVIRERDKLSAELSRFKGRPAADPEPGLSEEDLRERLAKAEMENLVLRAKLERAAELVESYPGRGSDLLAEEIRNL